MPPSILDDVVALARPDDTMPDDDLDNALDRCQQLGAELLPIEEHGRASLERVRQHLRCRQAGHAFPRISLEPLRWRDARGRPRLVLFPVDSNGTVAFVSPRVSIGSISPELPPALHDQYRDVLESHASSRGRWVSCHMPTIMLVSIMLGITVGAGCGIIVDFRGLGVVSGIVMCMLCLTGCVLYGETERLHISRTTFAGILPRHARLSVQRAQALGLQVYILAEPQGWNDSATTYSLDPLIVGYRNDQLWLIDRFDVTSVEHLVAEEYIV